MKPIFAIDITTDKKNEVINGDEFITKTIPSQASEEFENRRECLEQTVEKSKLPLWIRIVKYLSGVYALFVFIAIIKALGSISFAEALRNAPILIGSGIICGLIWLVLTLMAKSKEKAVMQEENAEEQAEQLEKNIQDIYDLLGVPADANTVDILTFNYKIKNEDIVIQYSALQSAACFNAEMKIYVNDGMLHITDLETVHSFKLDELKAIKTVNKRISILFWNKEEGPRSGEFKKYKMTENNVGNVFFKPYYILEGERDGQAFGIYFPCYEIDVLERLTGLTAKE
ncbi:MAG: hypothetical protein E7679_06270 [Ruminococcaceae bacterium]|nr:hypothetical protein [Oscillospiraceae bacterium]